jgi:hypothetical protein
MNKLTRQEVYTVIDAERAYQDHIWPDQIPGQPEIQLSPSDELRLIGILIDQANGKWVTTRDDIVGGVKVNSNDLEFVRKIAATAVRCMETWGAPVRKQPTS